MIIGLDARPLKAKNKTGISRYTDEIVKNSDIDIILFSSYRQNNLSYPNCNSLRMVSFQFPTYRWGLERVWEDYVLPTMINRAKPDIFWGPRFFVPGKLKLPTVATIHDIAFVKHPDVVSEKQYKYFDEIIKNSLVSASHFIAVSKTTKSDFCEHYGVSEDKVSVIYNGYNQKFLFPADNMEKEKIKIKYKLPEDFILFLGTIEPRKNLSRLIEAYKKSEAFDRQIPLVIAGKMGWLQNKLITDIEPMVNNGNIILTGFINDDELRVLYQTCTFFVFPSLYEGFGIPVLEAMASGAAVLTSHSSSLYELFHDSAHLVDPFSVYSISNGINQLLKEENRKVLIKRGYEITNQFSWKKAANQHLELFKSLI